MNNLEKISATLATISCVAPVGLMEAKQFPVNNERPNIILILADDVGYEAFGCNGGSSYKTPNIDKMAEEGMLFNYAYSQPLSAPTRSQFMTGKYNFRNYEAFGVMSPNTITFGTLLKNAGYNTGVSGKWQLYGNAGQVHIAGKTGCLPQEVGFDNYFVWHTTFPYLEIPDSVDILKDLKWLGYSEQNQRESRYKDPVILTEEGKFTFHDKYGPDLFMKWCNEFIDKNKNSDKPFFLYYPMVLMHDPFQATPKNKDYYKSSWKDKSDPKYFGEMMEYMDDIVGNIIKKVNDSGIADNTIIIFTADNGTNRKIYSKWNNQTIRGDKGYTREWGIHVPMIAYWKGHIVPGSINNNMIDFTDFVPTLMDIAQSPLPKKFKTDGLSFYDQMLGKKDAKKRDFIFGYYEPKWGTFENAIWLQDCTHTWKLYEDGRFYNLKNDPNEEKPLEENELSPKERNIRDEMKQRIIEILNS